MKRATLWVGLLAILVGIAALLGRKPPQPGPRVPRPPEPPGAEVPVPPAVRLPPLRSAPIKPAAPPAAAASVSGPAPAADGPAAPGGSKATPVRGKVRIQGGPPRPRKIRMDADPRCAALHAQPPIEESLVVDAAGGVRWAFVYVSRGAPASALPEGTPDLVVNQVGCSFAPRVSGARVGQPVLFRNGDPLLHNAMALAFANRPFNFGQPPGGVSTVTFRNPEVMVKVVCDVHPWMNAWIGVLDHPFFAVTNATGEYVLPPLPPGRYVIQAWHERYASVAKDLDLGGGAEEAELDFVLDEK